ncbi:hypothetical protein PC129_g8915 [Phytophthora cactorum]|uniref:Uncharacterized protein n=1 Tax=Phytophthora cactorum TaxID=29920 RepID=A0A329RYH3_9STRA|nr:hypothetical protein Pcac1_g1671 [Phytophthora cactorum]KAG2811987.1 hypothetical protein PC112_g15373 [Phytophthora cactorum]KAG2856639.1 hypothetical protein PC113_g11397 [Phytophthora cactorum]KAG2891180.1 hypothetical protein PC114_g17108 [Phytophthora cactorum]KAG2919101.1 hypothetical protein PC115_g10251 [Phytophthora cactorum]
MDYAPGDGAMVRQSDYEDLALHEGEDVLVTQETTTTMSVQRSGGGQDARRQIDQQAQTSAAARHHTVEEISRVREHQDVKASKTFEYLQQQHKRQLDLQEQQEHIRRKMTETRKQIDEHVRLLKAVELAMGEQGQRLKRLVAAVSPHVEARWGLFAGTLKSEGIGGEQEGRGESAREPMVTFATGANMPVPP